MLLPRKHENDVLQRWQDDADDRGEIFADDVANRLKSVVAGADTYTYTYNGLNNRVATITNGIIERYVLDQAAGLVQVLQDGDYAYLYGNARIAQKTATEAGYYLTDALGSVRQMVDVGGDVVLSRSYEPYGEVLAGQGTNPTPYGYTGEWTSSSTNLLYLRARWYSLLFSRFLTKDTWRGNDSTPINFNLWVYADSNPVNRTDPSGQCSGIPKDPKNPDLLCWIAIIEIERNYPNVKIGTSAEWSYEELLTIYRHLDYARKAHGGDYKTFENAFGEMANQVATCPMIVRHPNMPLKMDRLMISQTAMLIT
jgi:RHS repeat-associated protein